MPNPTDADIQFATLERCFRDLSWASVDARNSGADHEPLYKAMWAVRDQMEARFPEQWRTFSAKLQDHLERYGDAGDDQMMYPRVVNRHHYRNDDGEPDHKLLPTPYLYIGRGTPLGNPYTVKEHGHRALDMYRTHLWYKIKERDKKVLGAMAKITWNMHLVCSCAPRPCHGDVVVTCWTWLQRQPWWSKDEWL